MCSLRLVKSNSVSEYLDCWICAGVVTGPAELGTNVVSSGNGSIASKSCFGKVSSLLCHIEDEIGDLKVSLRDSKVENTTARRYVNRNRLVDTIFGYHSACEEYHSCSGEIHCANSELLNLKASFLGELPCLYELYPRH